MSHPLHLDSSARRPSFSRELTGRFADARRAAHPGAGSTDRVPATDLVPVIGGAWAS